jgi:glycosyltransferase involved in cell wall biosynthesis
LLHLPPVRIAMVSTPFIPTPPVRYGGTELVVWELTSALRELGHRVTLFTVGDDDGAERRALYRTPVWPPDPYHEANHAAWALAEILADGRFDVVHCHVPSAVPLARFTSPIVYTIHHDRDRSLTALYRLARGVTFVAVSDRQRELLPEVDDVETVHHGLDPAQYPFGGGGGPALFIGRLAEEKGPHVAIDVARSAGAGLTLAGDAHWKDRSYFEREIGPRLGAGVEWVGEVGHAAKVALARKARALLFPIDWEEPFGLVMIEAMLAGTPVLATPRGSVPEVVEQGVTGWICETPSEMTRRLAELEHAGSFDRVRCRERAVERFGRARMARDYLAVYERNALRAHAEEWKAGEGAAPRP